MKNCIVFLTVIVCFLLVTDEALAQDADRSVIVAASNMLHPPFSSWDADKKAVGIEVDIVNSAAKSIGQTVKWKEQDFGELFDAIEKDEIDIAVSTIGITEERKKKVDFSEPYFETEIVALVLPASKFKTLDQLKQLRIGADKSTTSFVSAKKRWPSATLVGQVAGELRWPEMLKLGKIDAFVVDASDQSRLESISKIKLRRIKESIATEVFCIALEKGNPKLLAAINESVVEIRPSVPLRIGDKYQFTSPLGRRVNSLKSPSAKLVNSYLHAKAKHEQNPDDVEATIWFGRRAGYLLRMNEAIKIYSAGIQKHPNDARLLRHRGHRYISTRQYDLAIADFEKAAKLVEGKSDEVEPDGAPNPQGIPLTTLQGNIWYHLGLAYYLKNDMENALRCFQKRVGNHRYDDNIVSTGHWSYMILRRLGKPKEAAGVIKDVNSKMKIIENLRYHQMCLFYAGQLQAADLESELGKQDATSTADDVLLYGLGNWQLYDQLNQKKCRERYEALMKKGNPFSFAFIAAESDYVRLFSKATK